VLVTFLAASTIFTDPETAAAEAVLAPGVPSDAVIG
jgi:hypothetical protein